MRKILLLIFIVSVSNCAAQTMSWVDNSTEMAYESHLYKCANVGLDSFFYVGNKFAFRMTTDNYAIEIWSYDSIKFQGREIFFTYTVEDSGKQAQYHKKVFDIKPDTVKMLLKFSLNSIWNICQPAAGLKLIPV